MARALIYLRQSLDRNDDRLAIERQLAERERYCVQHDFTVVRVITDNSVSASKRGRQGYAEVLTLMTHHAVDVVVILRIDRLMRLNDELEELIKLVEQHPVRVATCEGEIDLTTPQGRLIARVLVSVARAEMEVKSARHKLANRQKAAAGKPHGSKRPYGYEDDKITIRESEATVLREMARRAIAYQSFKDIAFWANDAGHRTTTGKIFHSITVRNLLHKKRYGGIREYEGIEYPACWQPIFDAQTYRRLRLTLRLRHERQTAFGAPEARKYLLTGLTRCGKCGWPLSGSKMYDRRDAQPRPVYMCVKRTDQLAKTGCSGVRRNADALDDFITECVLYRLDSPDLGKLLTRYAGDDDKVNALLAERDACKTNIDELVEDRAQGLLDRSQFARAKQTAESALARAEALLQAATQARGAVALLPVGESVRAWWAGSTGEQRRHILRLLIAKIVVNTGNTKPYYYLHDGRRARFDPSLIEIQWKV